MRLFEHKIARLKGAERAAKSGQREILLDIELRRFFEDADVWPGNLGVERNHHVARPAVVGNRGVGGRLSEQEIGLGQLGGGRLRIEVELADGFEFGVEKLQPQRARRLPGEQVEHAAAHRELAATGDGGNPFVAVLGEGAGKLDRIERGAGFERAAGGLEGLGGRCPAGECLRAADDTAMRSAGEDFQNGEPLGCAFGVGDGVVAIGWWRFRQDVGGDAPEFEFGGQSFAVPGLVADQPEAGFLLILGGAQNQGGEKRVRCLGSVVEHDLPIAGGKGCQALE